MNLDGQKLGLWQGLFVDLHGETRYGQDTNGIDGLVLPSNLPMLFPGKNLSITSLTGLKITQALSEQFAVYFGKINTLDEYPLRYSPGLGNNRPGLGGFSNSSLVFNTIYTRTLPYSGAAAGFAILKGPLPIFTFTVFDPQERATTGFENLFDRGVTIVPDMVLRGKLFDRPGLLNIGGTYSNSKYGSLDPSSYLSAAFFQSLLQRSPVIPQETGSWSVYTNFYQSIWVDSSDEKRTWGVFGQFGISDGNPNPIRFTATGGIGGRSMLRGRTFDTFGLGYYYLGLSENLKNLARPITPIRDEFGVELFYNYAITPWCRLTPNFQVARPSMTRFDTTILAGLRLQLLF